MIKKKKSVPDSVFFHYQQCIEKYLKAYLSLHNIEPPEIHDLQVLKKLSSNVDKDFERIGDDLEILNAYAVNFRYPGESATIKDAEEAFNLMKKLRKFILEKLEE